MNKGRPLDPIWEHFERKDGNKAKCLECGSESAALVERMHCFTLLTKVYIVDIIDTNDEKHTSVNLARIAQDHMKKAMEKYDVKIAAVVTDNAENMKGMRKRCRIWLLCASAQFVSERSCTQSNRESCRRHSKAFPQLPPTKGMATGRKPDQTPVAECCTLVISCGPRVVCQWLAETSKNC